MLLLFKGLEDLRKQTYPQSKWRTLTFFSFNFRVDRKKEEVYMILGVYDIRTCAFEHIDSPLLTVYQILIRVLKAFQSVKYFIIKYFITNVTNVLLICMNYFLFKSTILYPTQISRQTGKSDDMICNSVQILINIHYLKTL